MTLVKKKQERSNFSGFFNLDVQTGSDQILNGWIWIPPYFENRIRPYLKTESGSDHNSETGSGSYDTLKATESGSDQILKTDQDPTICSKLDWIPPYFENRIRIRPYLPTESGFDQIWKPKPDPDAHIWKIQSGSDHISKTGSDQNIRIRPDLDPHPWV